MPTASDNSSTLSKRLMVAVAVDDLLSRGGDFEDLHVGQICDVSGVSRSSFYRLFEDKYELPLWCQRFALGAGIREIGRTLDVVEGNYVTCSGLALFPHLMSAAGTKDGPRTLRAVSRELHAAYMLETLGDYLRVPLDDELRFQVDYTAMSQMETVGRWLAGEFGGMQALGLAELMAPCMPARLFSLLNDPLDHREPQVPTLASLIASLAAR